MNCQSNVIWTLYKQNVNKIKPMWAKFHDMGRMEQFSRELKA